MGKTFPTQIFFLKETVNSICIIKTQNNFMLKPNITSFSLNLNGFNLPKNFSNGLIKQTPTLYFYIRDLHKHSSSKKPKNKEMDKDLANQ